MSSTVVHIIASAVVSLVFVGVSCVPAPLEKANFVAELHDVQRREPVQPQAMNGNMTLNNKTDDNNRTMSNTNEGFVKTVKQYVTEKADVIYRALAVLGCISLIVVVYIVFRYFR